MLEGGTHEGQPDYHPARRQPAARSAAQQRHRVHRERTRCVRPARAAPAARAHAGRAGHARARQPAQACRPAREIRRAERAARSQRSAVLPRRVRQRRRNPAAHLHADGGARLRALRAHLPAAARHVHQHQRPRPDRRRARQLAAPGRHHRRHRRRAHPGPGRPGRQRHGHSGGQAVAVHRVRGRASGDMPADHARHGHQQRDAAQRPVLRRPAPPASHRRGLRRADRGIRHRRLQGVSGRDHPVRGFRQPQCVPPARALSRSHLHFQRRHPGHRGRGGGRHPVRAAGQGQCRLPTRSCCSWAPAKPRRESPT